MINKELFFKYNLNFTNIYNLIVEDNEDFIKIVPEIVFYEKGIWNNNKRIDYININISDIPYELRTIIDMMRDKKGFIGIKIKIKKEFIQNKIIIKAKFKLIGLISKIVNNAIKFLINIIFINIDDFNTEIKINYSINSIFFNEFNEKINNHIQHKLENYYIKKIDNHFINIST
jgi:hypothetical protein